MAASKAAPKKQAQPQSKDPSSKIVTFRLGADARQKITDYALAFGQSLSPSRQISNNQAVEHMILQASLPEKSKGSAHQG